LRGGATLSVLARVRARGVVLAGRARQKGPQLMNRVSGVPGALRRLGARGRERCKAGSAQAVRNLSTFCTATSHAGSGDDLFTG
jgi:hypothetical protein